MKFELTFQNDSACVQIFISQVIVPTVPLPVNDYLINRQMCITSCFIFPYAQLVFSTYNLCNDEDVAPKHHCNRIPFDADLWFLRSTKIALLILVIMKI